MTAKDCDAELAQLAESLRQNLLDKGKSAIIIVGGPDDCDYCGRRSLVFCHRRYAVGTDLGSTATESRYVSIKWDDGHRSFTGHAADRVGELARKRPANNPDS